jgi:hypothetical protein
MPLPLLQTDSLTRFSFATPSGILLSAGVQNPCGNP